MFFDLNDLEVDSLITADICIVGAGAAGISLAREFLLSNISVVLLESGDLEYDAATQALNEGTVSGLDYPLSYSRRRFFGGTTSLWNGQSHPLNAIDFESRSWVPNSGWPIAYADYVQYIAKAQEICQLGNMPFNDDSWLNSLNFPLDGETFHPIMLRFPSPVTRFGEVYREEISRAKNIRCILNANATNIEIGSMNSVEHIEIRSLQGQRCKVQAKKFVLACGAISNIKLLLNSRNKFSQGVGNEHGVVGKYFMAHPSYDTGQIEIRDVNEYGTLTKPGSKKDGLRIRTDFRLHDDLQKRYEILNHSLFLRPAWTKTTTDDFGGQVAKYWHRLVGKIDNYFMRGGGGGVIHPQSKTGTCAKKRQSDRIGSGY